MNGVKRFQRKAEWSAGMFDDLFVDLQELILLIASCSAA